MRVALLRAPRDLAASLADTGDDVTLVRARRPPRFLTARRGYDEDLGLVPATMAELLRGGFDVAHAFSGVDAWAAVRARALGGPPVVFTLARAPLRQDLVARRYRLAMTVAAATGAERCSVLSARAAAAFRRYLLRDPDVVPRGVFCSEFAVDVPRAPEPTVLVSAGEATSSGEAESLLRPLRAELPNVRFVFPDGALATTDGAARAYASAWATLVPASPAGFEVGAIESLAAGTPVVAERPGPVPELVAGDGLGALFDRGDEAGLVGAVRETLSFGADSAAVAACRAHAVRWDWSRVVPLYQQLQESAAG